MPEDSLSILEERVGKLLDIVVELREGKKRWEKERAILKVKVEEMVKRVEKVVGEEI